MATTDNEFSGEYSDPNHPGCKRTVTAVGGGDGDVTVSGTDAPGGAVWEVGGTTDGASIVVDFSPKGGPSNLTGTRVAEGIRWEDGNLWKTAE
eukprot:CAMPEP_0201125288 /NCGR_PEP_ID=MMETSP0850-20130426/20485_1 /ASSEMBLY_ACC=CAM_ASM_000622 /TAXON_ID=183588 /ORGANISM="Pseudo-nitzschia fraudulenta, Strain WWA7" /LENGTH=92 /DNA_ID=CAMNT_0047393219 /DNA_START=110 /DNA_END=388 /DNA_ORIENTATION=+